MKKYIFGFLFLCSLDISCCRNKFFDDQKKENTEKPSGSEFFWVPSMPNKVIIRSQKDASIVNALVNCHNEKVASESNKEEERSKTSLLLRNESR